MNKSPFIRCPLDPGKLLQPARAGVCRRHGLNEILGLKTRRVPPSVINVGGLPTSGYRGQPPHPSVDPRSQVHS